MTDDTKTGSSTERTEDGHVEQSGSNPDPSEVLGVSEDETVSVASTGDRESLDPGEHFGDVDEDFNYGDQGLDYGMYVDGELRITTSSGKTVRYRVSEPEEISEYDTLIADYVGIEKDRRVVVNLIIDEPAVTDEHWEEMTERERKLLSDRCHDWLGTDDFVNVDQIRRNLQDVSRS